MKLPLPLEPLACSVSNFNSLLSHNIDEVTVTLAVKGTPNPEAKFTEARSVFDEMANEDLISWNAILSGYSQEGNHGLVTIFVFVEMVAEGMGLDHVSFTSAVSACGHEMNLELGKQIHGLAIKSGYGSHCMNDRNVVSWTTMISIDEEDASLYLMR
ncbi:unnamed protein product [Prunus armeniaca]